MDDRRNRPPALGGLWADPHFRRIFEVRLLRQWAVHASRFHGRVQRALHPVCGAGVSNCSEWPTNRNGKCAHINDGGLRTNMGFIWFWLVAVMIVAYVVFDGFDIGVGIVYPFLARADEDKQVMLRSIGPVWDGNEVW